MNEWSKKKIPFFFLIDYLGNKTEICPLTALASRNIFLQSPKLKNYKSKNYKSKKLIWEKTPLSKEAYQKQFIQVKEAIQNGDTYLINLTCSTSLQTNYTLEELFQEGTAKYKLFYKNIFTHFSPEPFIQIQEGKIFSYPMKGTIDATVKNAEEKLLTNTKELKEQFTIVDLIRNDLSRVAKKVRVEKFRYIERIKTNQKELCTMSSKISGIVKPEYEHNLGNLFEKLLPAGSITGAPKLRTTEIIKNVETHKRNYYTGVWGIFDGENTDSCVIIRYIEKTKDGLVFKSGGGITSESDMNSEYEEMMDKVYVPIFRSPL